MAFVGQQLRQVALERSEHTHNRIAFDVRMFSDCICLIAEDSVIGAAALVDSVAYLSLTFANNRLLLRGGIARGRHFHSEDMVFSEALVEAYELESKIAKYPRTLVADSVAALARQEVPSLLRVDVDGMIFVDYLEYCSRQHRLPDHPYHEHKASIAAGLTRFAGQPAVVAKYEWLARYHDTKLGELAERPDSRGIIEKRMYLTDRRAV